ncbi:MAG TPA: family 1 glycosylhydrolase [Candidatus Saccharimonadales bacterium]
MNKEQLKKIKFWGASTSAHQVEGKNHNQWSIWELANAKELASEAEGQLSHWLPKWEEFKELATDPSNYVSGIAVDHYARYEADLDLLSQINLNAFRFSIEWSRVEPKPGAWDEVQIDHYRQVLKAMHRRRIEPFVCLWHWTVPVWFAESGGFANKKNVKHFVRFCEKIMAELGEYINYVIILNEPNVYAGMGYLNGSWPPQERSVLKSLRVVWHLAAAQKQAYTRIKAINKRLSVGLAYHYTHFAAGDNTLRTRLVVKLKNYGWNLWFNNRTESSQDFIGINYYQTDRIVKGTKQNTNERQNDVGWDMHPADIEHVILQAASEYKKPIIITENGLADKHDNNREWWLKQTFSGISKAMAKGAEVIGYMHWSLIDNFEWALGFWPRFGLVEVDRATLERKIRPSAIWLATFLKNLRSDSANR